MQVSPNLILILQEIMVVCILNYALNLGGFFLRELETQLQFDRPKLMVWISWESSHCPTLIKQVAQAWGSPKAPPTTSN